MTKQQNNNKCCIFLHHKKKKNEILPFATTWMNLRGPYALRRNKRWDLVLWEDLEGTGGEGGGRGDRDGEDM